MDDENAGGFLFSYDKLFGAKPLSNTDKKNEREGKDTTMLCTMRLFYVTCTRAEESLALIAYTNNQDAVRQTALSNSWFCGDEVILI
jgi:DNA helicase-2/ATP-dependent DNA helicase PcrA